MTATTDAIVVAVPFAASGATVTVPSEAGSLLRFAFDPANATAERAGTDLLFTLDSGGTVVLADFFAVADGALPVFVLPDGAAVTAADFFSGSDLDLTTAAGPSSGPQGGSGAGEYAADAGDLINGLDRLGSLGTDYWSRATNAPEEAIGVAPGYAPDAGPTAAGPMTPPDPGAPIDPIDPVEPSDHYNARAVLYHTDPAASGSIDKVQLLQGPNAPAVITGPGDFTASGFENDYFTCSLKSDGSLSFTLTDAGRTALADAGSGNVYDYITFRVGDFTYTMQVVANQDGDFDSASEDNKASGGKTLDGDLLYGEWHSEGQGSGSGSRTTSQGHDSVLFDAGKTEGGLIATDAPVFSGTLHTGGGNDQVTAYGRVDGASIAMGQGDDSFTVHGSLADSTVAMGQGSNTATGVGFDAAAVSSLDPYAGRQAYAVKDSTIIAEGDSTLTITAHGRDLANSMAGVQTGGNGEAGATTLSAGTVTITATSDATVPIYTGSLVGNYPAAQGIGSITSGGAAAVTTIKARSVTIDADDDKGGGAAGLYARGTGAVVSISADNAAFSANLDAGKSAEEQGDWSGLKGMAYGLAALQYSEAHVTGHTVDLYAAGGSSAYALYAFTNGAPAADATYGAHIAGTDGNDTVTLTAHSNTGTAVGVYCYDVGRATFSGGASTADDEDLGDVLRIAAHAHDRSNAVGMISGGHAGTDYIFESGHSTGSAGSIVVTRTEDVSITAISEQGSAYGMVASGQSSYGKSHNTIKDADGALKVTISAQGGGKYAGAMVANLGENVIQGGGQADAVSLTAHAAEGIAMGMYAARGNSACQGSNRLELGGGENTVTIAVSGEEAYGMYAHRDSLGGLPYNEISAGDDGSLYLTITASASSGTGYAMYANGSSGVAENSIIGGGGDDRVTLTGGITATGSGKNTITTGSGDDELHITGNVQGGTSIDMGADNDHLHITGDVQGATIDMGVGNDVLILESALTGSAVTGGAGMDTLGLKGGGAYDLDALAQQVKGFEVLDLTGGGADSLTINDLLSGLNVDAQLDRDFADGAPAELIAALAEGTVLRVHGDADDSVGLGDGWASSEVSVTYEGQTYQVYQHEGSTDYLLIQNGIIV